MGNCCLYLPAKEDLLLYFWDSLPIRNIPLIHFRDSIVNSYPSTILKVDSVMAFRKFCMNETYLLFSDNDDIRKVSKNLFEDLAIKFTPVRLVLLLSLLCQFDLDNQRNAKALFDISEYFGFELMRFENNIFLFEKYRITEIIKDYVEMIFNTSVGYIYSLLDENEYKDSLNQRYNKTFLDDWTNDFMKKYNRDIPVVDFLQDNHLFISDLFYLSKLEFARFNTINRKK
jgi:hypothetical protein